LIAHRATLGASMMLLEQQKKATNWAKQQRILADVAPGAF
jgi:hypothetical protein